VYESDQLEWIGDEHGFRREKKRHGDGSQSPAYQLLDSIRFASMTITIMMRAVGIPLGWSLPQDLPERRRNHVEEIEAQVLKSKLNQTTYPLLWLTF
jgi:hypothetical protein